MPRSISILVLLAATPALAQSPIFSNASDDPAIPRLGTGSTTSSGAPAPGGFTWSEVPANPGNAEANAVAGFSAHALAAATGDFRFADNFSVPAGRLWRLDAAALFAYQTGAPLPPGASPFAAVTIRLWDGPPGQPGSTILLGDTTTNRLLSSTATPFLRIFNQSLAPASPTPDTSRLIWRTDADLSSVVLPAGDYWLDWQFATVAADAVAFVPAVTIPGQRSLPAWNAQQLKHGDWVPALDPGKPDFAPDLPQDLPFILIGLDTCTADFNLDGAIDPDDLGDFINCYFGEASSPGSCPDADFNADGAIDPDDLGDFINTYFAGC